MAEVAGIDLGSLKRFNGAATKTDQCRALPRAKAPNRPKLTRIRTKMPVILLGAFIGGGIGLFGLLPYGFLIAGAGALFGGSIAALVAGGLLAAIRLRRCKDI